MNYPAELTITPLPRPPHATVSVPGSKSITNRALVLAALRGGERAECTLTGALRSEDTEVMIDCLRRLKYDVQTDWERGEVRVIAPGLNAYTHDDQWIPDGPAELFVGNSGTTIRFLTALLALGNGTYRLDGVPRMRERPIGDLLDALRQLRVEVQSEAGNGCPPVVIRAWGTLSGATATTRVRVKADVSSQYLSGLLMVAPYAKADETVFEIDGPLVSEPYVDMTIRMMWAFGLMVHVDSPGVYHVPGEQYHRLAEYAIEPDASSASYFFAAAAITGGSITVRGMKRNMLQGDVKFVECLEAMGCEVEYGEEGVTVRGKPLRGIDTDMNAISDTVMTLAAVACFADGPTTIRNVAHIRHKETDRIAAVATELRKLGAEVEEFPDGLRITPRPLTGCAVDTYNDHRMAMSLALVGLKVHGVVIRNPGCVAKTYPGFWQDFDALRG